MKSLNINSKKGFTIIEVVLVLAIAGLIFLMVFIALPNMQRNQRDTQRRQDYASFAANVSSYMTNNNGNLPGDCKSTEASGTVSLGTGICKSPEKYVNASGADQSGKTYIITVLACDKTTAGTACTNTDIGSGGVMSEMTQNSYPRIVLIKKAQCGTDQGVVRASAGNRDYAILGQLETGVYCQDNV